MDTPEPVTSELAEPIWAISWHDGTWPEGGGISYANAEMARETAVKNYPGVEFTIVTFEAAEWQRKNNEKSNSTV